MQSRSLIYSTNRKGNSSTSDSKDTKSGKVFSKLYDEQYPPSIREQITELTGLFKDDLKLVRVISRREPHPKVLKPNLAELSYGNQSDTDRLSLYLYLHYNLNCVGNPYPDCLNLGADFTSGRMMELFESGFRAKNLLINTELAYPDKRRTFDNVITLAAGSSIVQFVTVLETTFYIM